MTTTMTTTTSLLTPLSVLPAKRPKRMKVYMYTHLTTYLLTFAPPHLLTSSTCQPPRVHDIFHQHAWIRGMPDRALLLSFSNSHSQSHSYSHLLIYLTPPQMNQGTTGTMTRNDRSTQRIRINRASRHTRARTHVHINNINNTHASPTRFNNINNTLLAACSNLSARLLVRLSTISTIHTHAHQQCQKNTSRSLQ
jgi:hypothetical protein